MVFTGIVEEQGTVLSLQEVPDLRLWDGSTGAGWKLTVGAKLALEDAYIGQSKGFGIPHGYGKLTCARGLCSEPCALL